AELRNKKLVEVFDAIETKTDYVFAFPDGVKKSKARFSFRFDNQSLDKVLLEVSEKARVRFQVIDLTITAAFVDDPLEHNAVSIIAASPQPATITGVITDERGSPLPGVSVLVRGTNNGTASDV